MRADPITGFAVVVLVVMVALWAVVWHLRRTATAEADAQTEVAQRIAVEEARRQVAEEGPPPAPAPPTVEAVAAALRVDPYPPGVSASTPVWLAAADRQFVKAHRLSPSGWRTPEGYAVVVEQGRELGVTLPAGMALATRQVQFCRRCWPAVPVMPDRSLPRRSLR